MSTDTFAYQHELLDDLVMGGHRQQAVDDLRAYFDTPLDQGGFSGSLFDSYGGRGDNPEVRDKITDTDFIAVSLLGMGRTIPSIAWAFALDDLLSQRTGDLLRQIPVDVPLADAPYELIADGSPADELWKVIASTGTNRWVTAHKLLNRKRPNLLPIADGDVMKYLGEPERFWDCMWSWLKDPDRVQAVEDMRSEVGTIGHVSLLRTLDVPMWMAAKRLD